MWIKTEDQKFIDVTGCTIAPDKDGTVLTATPHGGKPIVLATNADIERFTRNVLRLEAAIVDRRPLVDLT